MGKWDENSGYYCLLIAIFCGLDVYESVLMYKYGPNHPLCQKILRKKIKTEYNKTKIREKQNQKAAKLTTNDQVLILKINKIKNFKGKWFVPDL